MKRNDLLRMCLQNLMRRKSRTFLTVLGVLIGCCSIVIMVSLGIGMKESQEKLLAEIIFNLCDNAIKYNQENGHVAVSVTREGDRVVLTVQDTGIGIPEEDRLNVFSRFYRVDKARSREAGGSGLGLSIVHDAVVLHGGTITVGQNKPRGTKFTVSFPRPTPEETGI